MSLQSQYQNNPIINDRTKFLAQLAMYKVVDIGQIQSLEPGGHYAIIKLDDDVGTTIRCELLSLGSAHGTLTSAMSGQFCLVFFTPSQLDMYTRTAGVGSPQYSMQYAKAIPVSTIAGNVHINATTESISIASSTYSMTFGVNQASLQSNKLAMIADMVNGAFTFSTENGNLEVKQDGSIKLIQGGQYDSQTGDLTSANATLDIDTSGNVSLQTGVSDGEAKCEVVIAADGSITFNAKKAISWTQNGVTLHEVLDEFAKILEQLQTDGSPAKHAISATSAQKITQWRTNQLDKFTE